MGQCDRLEQLGPYCYQGNGACFPLGRDSLELGAFATVRPRWRVCDLGCGGGVLLLLLAGRAEGLTLAGVEREAAAAETARANLARNALPGTILTGDLRTELLPAGAWDLAVSNPPYFQRGTGTSGGGARMEEHLTLPELCAAAGRLLRHGGRFALVHRPERLADLMACLRGAALEPKRLRLIQHDGTHAPSAVLLEAAKHGRPGLEILPVRLLHPAQPE